jgi:ribonuclease G
MTRRLLITVSPGEYWAAAAEQDELAGLRLIRSFGEARRGDVYLGRVVGLRPDFPAALIEIGFERPAFLSGADMAPDTRLREGEAVTVLVAKEARADKAAGVTMKLNLPEARLMAVRRAAATAEAPALLDARETPLAALLRAFADPVPDEIVLDDSAAFAAARGLLPQGRSERLKLHRETTPLFEAFGVAAAIETALSPRVPLARGGAITIETAAAATLIDVDSGSAGALVANLAAAPEIARQIRLRDLSGPIVIDFIDMKRGDKSRVQAALTEALDGDAQALGWTKLGHFELVRKRRHPALGEQLYEYVPGGTPAKKPVTVALEALRDLRRESLRMPGKRLALRVHPEIAAFLDRTGHGARHELEQELGFAVKIIAENRARDSYDIVPV